MSSPNVKLLTAQNAHRRLRSIQEKVRHNNRRQMLREEIRLQRLSMIVEKARCERHIANLREAITSNEFEKFLKYIKQLNDVANDVDLTSLKDATKKATKILQGLFGQTSAGKFIDKLRGLFGANRTRGIITANDIQKLRTITHFVQGTIALFGALPTLINALDMEFDGHLNAYLTGKKSEKPKTFGQALALAARDANVKSMFGEAGIKQFVKLVERAANARVNGYEGQIPFINSKRLARELVELEPKQVGTLIARMVTLNKNADDVDDIASQVNAATKDVKAVASPSSDNDDKTRIRSGASNRIEDIIVVLNNIGPNDVVELSKDDVAKLMSQKDISDDDRARWLELVQKGQIKLR